MSVTNHNHDWMHGVLNCKCIQSFKNNSYLDSLYLTISR